MDRLLKRLLGMVLSAMVILAFGWPLILIYIIVHFLHKWW